MFYKFFLQIFFVIYKNEWDRWFNLLLKKQNVIINKAKDYYKNNKERLKEQARGKYRSLSQAEKNKKREYRRHRYRNVSEEKRQKLKEFQKNYYKTKMSQHNNE